MPITALYAALLAPLFVVLSARVIAMRRGARAPFGDGGNALLQRRMRVQANFAEYVPFAVILIALAESLHVHPLLLHLLGIVLVAGRLSHAYGVSQPEETFAFRVSGMMMTFGVILVAALACLVKAVFP